MLSARQLQRLCLLTILICLLLLLAGGVGSFLYSQKLWWYHDKSDTLVSQLDLFNHLAKDTLRILLVIAVIGAVYLAKKE
ncbi:hypothetical protein J2I47_25635 [Fibrella sp. HMF5335]|uniref:Uncharacterized protein n=1 Tax=Fibrella rubiginis TaxID=2817060 RepID=A0A939K7H4_9BACT|nr:hypothetical protein [Fibrella rubiginis]MBO0939953.1 hypothetical protein [Fibrella rubiginis]